MSTPAIRTTCPYCGVGCGVIATQQPDGGWTVQGDPDHPANFGRLCSKGTALAETIALDGRLLAPRIAGQDTGWPEALDLVANRFSAAIAEFGPDSVAFYVSGQLLTEDYYVANKLMKGFIGSANIDTNSRLCMASSVAGHRRAFGSDTVPGLYSDLEEADLVVLVGSNLAWCHPVLYQRLAAAKAARPAMRIVVIDPRRTTTADLADLFLPIAPDGDVALFLGLLARLEAGGYADAGWHGAHVNGMADALAATQAVNAATLPAMTGLAPDLIERFFTLFCDTEKVVTVYSQGVNQSASGTDKVNAIINCHLLTGRIGQAGMGPFSVTGQPNAMGGRETGGLANMLAAHMDIENPGHRDLVQAFWQSPAIAEKPGLKAVDLFQAVADGKIKAIWIMATNPVDSMPDADAVRAAIAACPFVVVSDLLAETDTAKLAHVLLPALGWGEKDGTVTNSERRMSRQRAFLPTPGVARPDWWALCEVARRMGHGAAFDYTGPHEILAEFAALSGTGNDGSRDFDISALADLDAEDFARLAPFQWPYPQGQAPGETRFFAKGGFYTPDGKARAIAVHLPRARDQEDGALTLNTGRVRDHWHTMTRTGRSATLSAHIAEPYAEIHPDDAIARGIAPADLVEVTSPHGRAVLRALLSTRQRKGSVFVPMHWSEIFASTGRIDALVAPRTDPVSGQPASKQMQVRIARKDVAIYGFALLRERPSAPASDYWAVARTVAGWRLELAWFGADADFGDLARTLLGEEGRSDTLSYHDAQGAEARFARFTGARLTGLVYLSRQPVELSRHWAAGLLSTDFPNPAARMGVLAGRADAARPDPGPIICACNGVGANTIQTAIQCGAADLDAIGACTNAGTNCGSCRAEIRGMLHGRDLQAAE